mmetsp:Transcript_33747/g.97335  ORF Transcript_33747/g.97335 Transcript_33747/m.97335 type:complete len:261 (+) Transcript_33747:1187-1969(+)
MLLLLLLLQLLLLLCLGGWPLRGGGGVVRVPGGRGMNTRRQGREVCSGEFPIARVLEEVPQLARAIVVEEGVAVEVPALLAAPQDDAVQRLGQQGRLVDAVVELSDDVHSECVLGRHSPNAYRDVCVIRTPSPVPHAVPDHDDSHAPELLGHGLVAQHDGRELLGQHVQLLLPVHGAQVEPVDELAGGVAECPYDALTLAGHLTPVGWRVGPQQLQGIPIHLRGEIGVVRRCVALDEGFKTLGDESTSSGLIDLLRHVRG